MASRGAESFELRIDSLASSGDGVGRSPNGRAVFVPFTAPGDLVRVRVDAVHARYLRARVEELLEPGLGRTDPLCAVFGSCGGCTWQHVEYDLQLEAKRRILHDALQRVGRLAFAGEIEVTPSPLPYGYRGRTRVLAKDGRVGYRRRRSHALCATARCPVLVPALDARLLELGTRRPREDGEWELVAGADGSTRSTPLARPLATGPRIALEVCGDRIEVSPGVFVQANPLLFDAFAAHVHGSAGRGALAVELFAGAGFFTLGLARRFGRVVAVESEGRSARDLRRNLAGAALSNVTVVGGRVESLLKQTELAGSRPDAAVLDPPRIGLPAGASGLLARLAPARIVYVSCDPASLARDLADFAGEGYALTGVRGFDLFPQTPHVEAVALLERRLG